MIIKIALLMNKLRCIWRIINKLLKKVNDCAEGVAKGISKAAHLKKFKKNMHTKEEVFEG